MSYWKANPHQHGPGRTHLLHPDGDRTRCGRKLINCPGRHVPEDGDYDCRACAGALETAERRLEADERYEQQRRIDEARLAAERREWQRQYAAYLESPEWLRRRAAVMKRAKGICEGCGEARAVEVHHTTYSHVFNEMLFELVAICRDCHQRITAIDRGELASRSATRC